MGPTSAVSSLALYARGGWLSITPGEQRRSLVGAVGPRQNRTTRSRHPRSAVTAAVARTCIATIEPFVEELGPNEIVEYDRANRDVDTGQSFDVRRRQSHAWHLEVRIRKILHGGPTSAFRQQY